MAPPGSPDSEVRFRAFFEQSMDGVLFTRPDGTVSAANPAACAILARPEAEICRLGRAGLADPTDPRWAEGVEERLRTGAFRGDLRMLRGDGTAVDVELTSKIFEERGGGLSTCVVFRDVSERLRLERELTAANERLARLALFDELTGVHNRRGFLLMAAQELHGAARRGERPWLLFIDVDGLKRVNDVLGHKAGDRTLVAVAGLVQRHARRSDVVGRVGGDEFVVLVTGASASALDDVVARLDAAAQELTSDPRAAVSLSYGAAQVEGAGGLEEAIAAADQAMYTMKQARGREAGTSGLPEV